MEAELTAEALLLIRLALTDLNSDFCYYLDHGLVDELAELFCADTRYSHGKRTSVGRDEVRRLFEYRRGAQNRTSRHILSGLRLQVIDRHRATGQSVCLTFAANAQPPVSPATPYLVADFNDEYRVCSDGRWCIKKRHIERIFTAEGNKGPEKAKNR